jgi:hypothetical protein
MSPTLGVLALPAIRTIDVVAVEVMAPNAAAPSLSIPIEEGHHDAGTGSV